MLLVVPDVTNHPEVVPDVAFGHGCCLWSRMLLFFLKHAAFTDVARACAYTRVLVFACNNFCRSSLEKLPNHARVQACIHAQRNKSTRTLSQMHERTLERIGAGTCKRADA